MAFRGRRPPPPPAPGIQAGAPVHLLTGEEAFLRGRRARELAERLAPSENPDYNLDVFQGPDLDLHRVVASCEMLPIFADRRLVVVRHLDLKLAAAHDSFMAYLGRPNPTTVLLLVAGTPAEREGDGAEEAPRKGAAKGRPRATVKDLLALIASREEFSPLRPEQALAFLHEAARARGATLRPDAAQALAEAVGTDAARLDDEIEKAVLYVGPGRAIEASDIDLLARRTRPHTVFELTDAIALGDRDGVLRHLHALLEDGAEPVYLVGMIAWHLRRTWKGAALVGAGARPDEVARACGVLWKLADRFAQSCGRLGTARTARAIAALRTTDRRIKSTAEDPRLLLERTLLEMLPATAAEAKKPVESRR